MLRHPYKNHNLGVVLQHPEMDDQQQTKYMFFRSPYNFKHNINDHLISINNEHMAGINNASFLFLA